MAISTGDQPDLEPPGRMGEAWEPRWKELSQLWACPSLFFYSLWMWGEGSMLLPYCEQWGRPCGPWMMYLFSAKKWLRYKDRLRTLIYRSHVLSSFSSPPCHRDNCDVSHGNPEGGTGTWQGKSWSGMERPDSLDLNGVMSGSHEEQVRKVGSGPWEELRLGGRANRHPCWASEQRNDTQLWGLWRISAGKVWSLAGQLAGDWAPKPQPRWTRGRRGDWLSETGDGVSVQLVHGTCSAFDQGQKRPSALWPCLQTSSA